MGGDIDGRLEVSFTLPLQQSLDLEKTQVELRQTFNVAEKFRRELEYLQKGGNPLDLICGDATSVSGQSTSLAGHHLDQFVTSDTKGNFGVTASPLNDSVGSSGRLGGHSVCEPNSADNLVLFDGNNKFPKVERRSIAPLEHYTQLHSGQHAMASGDSVALEVPKKSYTRRNRSRPNHDGARSSPIRDVKGLVVAADVARNDLSNFNYKIKGSSASVTIKNLDSNSCVDTDLDGVLAVETIVGQIWGSSFAISTGSQNSRRNQHDSTEGFDSELSCTQKAQSLDVNNDNELPTSSGLINCNGQTEQNLATNEVKEGNKLVKETDCTTSKNANCNIDLCHRALNEDSSIIKEVEGLKGSESPLQNGSKNLVSAEGVNPDGSVSSETERKPCDRLQDSVESSESKLSVRAPNDVSEQPVNSQENLNLAPRAPNDVSEQPAKNNLNLATEAHEDFILKEAQMIEEKHKRMSELCLSTLSLQSHQNSHWDFVLGEMAWLANDFAQERLWKLTAAAQISRRAAFASHVRFQRQVSLWKQKEVAQILGRDVMEFWHMTEAKCKDLELQCLNTDSKQGLQGYAMRFLKYNSAHAHCSTEHVSSTPDLISDVGTIGWDDNLTEENFVYMVPPGAVKAYRKSIESYLLRCERTWNGLQEEVDTSICDAVAVDAYEDNDGATRVYYLPGESERSKESNDSKKSEKNFKFSAARSYEMGADFPFMQSIEKNIESQPSVLSGKRSDSSLNFSLTTNHVRTASRQRVVGPFNALNKTDASSDETDSFQDEHSGGAHMPNNMEAQSLGDYEKQLWFDSVEVSDRPQKIKKARHQQGSSYKHRWQFDSGFQNFKKDHIKRRLDVHQLDNGRNGLYIQHNMKKLKIRQSSNDIRPFSRSVSSPMTSQMSNMSNPKKFLELLVSDGGKKSKTLKMQAGQPGSGNLWSLFEDQFLVVLVHDMGPNWELISDITNSNLQFKRIFRSSDECKERHKVLMDRSTGDRVDTAEDSGSDQPYPSTLPGIPEGSARQLFQRLQGPMEEETLKSHFEKIIVIGKKQYNRRKQKHNQDPKQLQPPHSSIKLALSQVSPNNLNGGDVLTPFDLCDAIESIPDAPSVGCQSSRNGGLQYMDQRNKVSMLPSSSSSSFVSGSSTLASGNEFSSVSIPLNPSARDGRYGVPRKGLLPKDDQQKTHQYNHMLSSRTNMSPGFHLGMGRGIPMLPSGNNVGVMSAVNRGMPMARPVLHGVPSMPSTVSLHSRAVPGQGSSIPRPHNGMHLMRPNHNHNTDHQRKIPPVSQGQSSQVVPQFAPNISHPGFEMRIVKERKLKQQRALQHQQFTTSNAMIPLVQSPKSHLPVTSPQTSIQIQSQKLQLLPPHENMLNPQTGGNQILKQQCQSRQFKQHQQKAHSSQVQAKLQQQKPDNSKHQNHVPSLLASPSTMPHQKLVNLSQLASPKKMVKNELVDSSEETLTSSKLQTSPPQTSGVGDSSEPI